MDSFLGIPVEFLGTLAPSGIVTLFVIAILFGKLVPKGTADERKADATQRVEEARAEASVWRESYFKAAEANSTYAAQAQTSVELAEGLSRLLDRIAPELRRGGDGQ